MKLLLHAMGLALLSGVLVIPPASADCVDYEDYFHLEVSLGLPGSAYGIAVLGDYAYLAEAPDNGGESCLDIVDIANPGSPEAVGHLHLPTGGVRVAVSGNHAYVTEGGSEQDAPALLVVDITDPRSPQAEGIIELPPGAGGVAVSGAHAFVANGSSGLRIIDVSDPTHPWLKGHLETTGSTSGVAFRPGLPGSRPKYAYVADGDAGLLVVDIKSLVHPRVVGSTVLDEWVTALDVVVSGDYAFVAAFCAGLYVVDIATPTQPHVIGHIDTPGCAYGIAVSGSRVFIADDGLGLQVIDVSDPYYPRILGGVNCGYMYGCAVAGDYAFIAADVRGLQVIDVAGDESVQPLGDVQTPGQAQGLVVSSHHAFVSCGEQGLRVVDVADPEHPVIVGGMDTPGWASRPALMGRYVCLPDGGPVVRVIDVSDPTTPQQAARIDAQSGVCALAVDQRYLYVSEEYYFEIFDLLDPSSPQVVGGLPEVHKGPVTVAGDYAYVAGWTELRIIRVANPHNPVSVGEMPISGTTALFISGSYLYAAENYPPRLGIIDVSTPSAPLVVSSVASSSWVTGVALSGNHVYLASYEGVQVIDVEDPLHPRTLGGGDTADLANCVEVANGFAYLSLFGHGYYSGLVVFPSQCPDRGWRETSAGSGTTQEQRISLRVAPNPARAGTGVSFTNPTDGPVRATIHDVTGRRVRVLQRSALPTGFVRLDWDGRDDHGREVAAGLYLARVRTKTGEGSARIVMLR